MQERAPPRMELGTNVACVKGAVCQVRLPRQPSAKYATDKAPLAATHVARDGVPCAQGRPLRGVVGEREHGQRDRGVPFRDREEPRGVAGVGVGRHAAGELSEARVNSGRPPAPRRVAPKRFTTHQAPFSPRSVMAEVRLALSAATGCSGMHAVPSAHASRAVLQRGPSYLAACAGWRRTARIRGVCSAQQHSVQAAPREVAALWDASQRLEKGTIWHTATSRVVLMRPGRGAVPGMALGNAHRARRPPARRCLARVRRER